MKRFWIIYSIVTILVLLALTINYKSNSLALCNSEGKIILPFENSNIYIIYDDNLKKYYFWIKDLSKNYKYYDFQGNYLFNLKDDIYRCYNGIFYNNSSLYDKKGNLIIRSNDTIQHENNYFYNINEKETHNIYDTKKRKLIFPTNNTFQALILGTNYITIIKNNKYGLCDFNGNIIVPCKYKNTIIDIYNDIFICGENNMMPGGDGDIYLCDKKDNILHKGFFNYFIIKDKLYLTIKKDIKKANFNLHPFRSNIKSYLYENNKLKTLDFKICPIEESQSHDLYLTYYTIEKNDKVGVWNNKEEFIIPIKYDAITLNSETGFIVNKIYDIKYNSYKMYDIIDNTPEFTYKKGFFNLNGKEILPCKYDFIKTTKNGYIIATIHKNNSNHSVDYLFDKNGKLIISGNNISIKKDKVFTNNKVYDLKGNILLDNIYFTDVGVGDEICGEYEHIIYTSFASIERINNLTNKKEKAYINLDTLKIYKDPKDYLIEKNPKLKNKHIKILSENEDFYLLHSNFGWLK